MKILLILFFLVKENLCEKLCEEFYKLKQNETASYAIFNIPSQKIERWTILNISMGANGKIYNNNRYLRLHQSKEKTVTRILNGKQIKYRLLIPKINGNITIKFISLNGNVLCMESNKFFTNNWSFEHTFLLGKTSIVSEHFSNKEEIYPKFSDWIYSQPKHPHITRRINKDKEEEFMKKKNANTIKQNDKLWMQKLKCQRERSPVPTQLILNGVIVKIGEFPWLVYFEYSDKNFICGGSLISDRHVITAAHCVENYPQGYLITTIHLGRYNRMNLNEYGAMTRKPKNIYVHPEYDEDKGEAHADIALVTIDPVPLTRMISPICIWPYKPTTRHIGIVAGWGVSMDDGLASVIPMKSTFPLVSLEKCRQSHSELAKLATNHTLCAGGGTSGPCYGDSGSGLYIFQDNTYYLRGIISSSLTRDGTNFCSVKDYSVYVDIVYYLDWLHLYMSDLL